MLLDDVQAGDKVLLIGMRGGVYEQIVARTTKTRIVLTNGTAYTRMGIEIGGDTYNGRIVPFDQARLDEHRMFVEERDRQKLVKRIRSACSSWVDKDMTEEELMRFYADLRNKGMQEVK